MKLYKSLLPNFLELGSSAVEKVFLGKKNTVFLQSLSFEERTIAEMFFSGMLEIDIRKNRTKGKKGQSAGAANAWVTMVRNKILDLSKNNNIKIDYSYAQGKWRIRNKNKDEVEYSATRYKITKGLILSLSSFDCMGERHLNTLGFDFDYLLCEMEPYVLLMLFERSRELKYSSQDFRKMVFAGLIGEVIRSVPSNTFAHINLDLCKSIIAFGEDIKIAIQKDIVIYGGTIMITISNSRSVGVKNTEELEKIINEYGRGKYEIVRQDGYRDSAGMYSAIIRRVKK